ncbi:MAG: aminomethyl-transferring glycine dehydrogenase subunit GcvPB, partial [Eubacterium sp.]
CMHEFVMSLEKFHKEDDVSALDVAKALLDFGIHPPTMYFPLIVDEALMVEPTETETRETLDNAIAAFRKIYEEIIKAPKTVAASPQTTPIKRLDEVGAARHPVLRYNFDQE